MPEASTSRRRAESRIHRTPDDPGELSAIAPALPLNAVMFYRHMLDRAGAFDPSLWILEDYEFLLRLEGHGPIAFSSAPTLELHVPLGLDNALGALLHQYLPNLDRIYAANPVSPQIAAQRQVHRTAVERAIARVAGGVVGPDETAHLVATMAGRAVVPAR